MSPATAHRVGEVHLAVDSTPLAWEAENAQMIDARWAEATEDNPTLFDGRVFLISEWEISDTTFPTQMSS